MTAAAVELPLGSQMTNVGMTKSYNQNCQLASQAETGDGRLRAYQQRFRSVRFARYGTQELAAASESLLCGAVGDIDHSLPAIGLCADGVETSQQDPRQLSQKKECLLG